MKIRCCTQVFWLSLLLASFTACHSAKEPPKLVVLTFDDAVRSHLEFVAPLLKEKGFGATFFISHAWMEINLARVDSALAANGVPKPVSFRYPGNHYAPGTVEKIRALGYRFARRGMQPEIPYGQIAHGPLFDPEVNHRLVVPTAADAYPEWTLDHFKTIIRRAEEGKALVLQFHGVPDQAHPWVHTDPGLFAQFMDYLEETGVQVIALRDLDKYLDIVEVNDPALGYRYGIPGSIKNKDGQKRIHQHRCHTGSHDTGPGLHTGKAKQGYHRKRGSSDGYSQLLQPRALGLNL